MSLVTKTISGTSQSKFRILAVANRISRENLVCPVLEFFQKMERDHPRALARLAALLDRTAEHGPLRNEEKFKHLAGTDGLFEFKAKPLRLLCFFDKQSIIICTNGAVKKTTKADPNSIKAAEGWKQSYFVIKNSGKLTHEHEN